MAASLGYTTPPWWVLCQMFQFDMEDKNSWFSIPTTLEHRKRPAVFGQKDVTPVSRRAFGGAGDARIYRRAQPSEIWDKILVSAASRKSLEKISRELIIPNTAIHVSQEYSYYAPWTDFYVANMICSNYFKINFWPLSDQLSTFWNSVEFISLDFFVYQTYRWFHSDGLKTYGKSLSYSCITWIWQDTSERFL